MADFVDRRTNLDSWGAKTNPSSMSSDAILASIADGSITDAKLHTSVKIGDLADWLGDPVTNILEALNDLLGQLNAPGSLLVMDEVTTLLQFAAGQGLELEFAYSAGEGILTYRVREVSARLIGTTNVGTYSGGITLDSTAGANNDIVFLVGETDATKNGLYVLNTGGAWSRPTWWKPYPGQRIAVREGSATGTMRDTIWMLVNDTDPVLGTDALYFRRVDARAVTIGGVTGALTISKHTFPRCHVFCTAAANPGFTITLPSAADYAFGEIYIKATFVGLSGTNRIRVAGPGTETVEGAAFYDLASARAQRQFISDGSNWWIAG
jgi:hypothetical protein